MKHFLYLLCALSVVGGSLVPAVGLGQTKADPCCLQLGAGHVHILPSDRPVLSAPAHGAIWLMGDTVCVGEGNTPFHFLRIGSRTYRIVRPEAYIEEVGGNPWTGFGIDEGPAGWGTMDGSRMPARLDSIKFPWSVDPPLAPYTGHYDSSARMWIWGRNRGTITRQPEILWHAATSALLRKVIDSFVLSTDQSDTNRIYAGPKKKKHRKP